MSLVTLKGYSNATFAHIDKGLLDSQGIFCIIDFENTGSIPEITGDFLLAIKLKVKKEDYLKAMEALSMNIA